MQNPDIVEKALKEPQNFVLKPQREGGGKFVTQQAHRFGLKAPYIQNTYER